MQDTIQLRMSWFLDVTKKYRFTSQCTITTVTSALIDACVAVVLHSNVSMFRGRATFLTFYITVKKRRTHFAKFIFNAKHLLKYHMSAVCSIERKLTLPPAKVKEVYISVDPCLRVSVRLTRLKALRVCISVKFCIWCFPEPVRLTLRLLKRSAPRYFWWFKFFRGPFHFVFRKSDA